MSPRAKLWITPDTTRSKTSLCLEALLESATRDSRWPRRSWAKSPNRTSDQRIYVLALLKCTLSIDTPRLIAENSTNPTKNIGGIRASEPILDAQKNDRCVFDGGGRTRNTVRKRRYARTTGAKSPNNPPNTKGTSAVTVGPPKAKTLAEIQRD
jgi:hypothetical protein